MAGKKITLNKLYEEFKSLKDRHEKDITRLEKLIEEQGTKIKVLEKLSAVDKPNDIHKKSRKTVPCDNFNMKNMKKFDSKQLKCNNCENRFTTFSELELHIKEKHDNFQGENCEQCGKMFVTAWRLRKHMRIHSQLFTKTCKYFEANIVCPFEELGCKFKHDVHIKDTFDERDDMTMDNIVDTNDSKSLRNASTCEKVEDTSSFHTSTPKSISCKECMNKSDCTYCFVRHTLGIHGGERRLHF